MIFEFFATAMELPHVRVPRPRDEAQLYQSRGMADRRQGRDLSRPRAAPDAAQDDTDK